MAGLYPNAPSWRMAYDRDGTVCVAIVNGVITQLTAADMVTMNDEAAGVYNPAGQSANNYLVWLFPELRDIDGFCFIGGSGMFGSLGYTVQVSRDTTNGQDGTWTALGGAMTLQILDASPNYRAVTATSALGIRGLRIKWTFAPGGSALAMRAAHLYGEISAGQQLDRLLLWHPTIDERVPPSYFDFGDTPRSSSADRPFRVKNVSTTKTANNIRVAMEALTDTNPSTPGLHSISSGGSFAAQVTLPSLAAGATSDVLTLRRITPSNAQLGLSAMRLFAEAGSWSV